MFQIYDVNQAQETILKRSNIDQMSVSPVVAERLEKLFGQPTSPEDAVRMILLDVREQGDRGLSQLDKKIGWG